MTTDKPLDQASTEGQTPTLTNAQRLAQLMDEISREEALLQAKKIQANEIVSARRAEILNSVMVIITENGISPEELGFPSNRQVKITRATAVKTAAVAKYRGPAGELWSGGRGRKPRWIVAGLAEGKSLADFAI